MEKHLNTPIKEIIARCPRIGEILNEYRIGCVPCSVGSCLLKDIVSIHNLSAEDEAELMCRIEKEIYPEREVKKAKIKARPKPTVKELKYSPPVKRLVDEHASIKKLIALIPQVIELIKEGAQVDKELVLDCIYFIRNYADKFHHAKEEDILFDYTDRETDIIKTMLLDHTTARNHVKVILEAKETGNKAAIIEHLNGYKELLTEHIKKEDEILYPWIDRGLSTKQVGELFGKFNEVDAAFDRGVVENCQEIILNLEQRTKRLKKEVVK